MSFTSQSLVVLLVLGLFYFTTQFVTERIIGNDGHFHIRYSRSLLERGIPAHLPELRYTIWNDSYRDHHFLFHLLQIPFSLTPDIAVGAKIAAVFFAVVAGLAFWWALSQLKVYYKWFWLILFMAGSCGFLFRVQMPRVQSVAMALLLVVIVCLLRKNHWTLFFAAFANVWLYDSFMLLFAVGFSWLISNRLWQGRWDIKPIVFMILGLFAGAVVNPYFPDNVMSYFFNAKRSLAPLGSIPISSEWYPEEGWRIILNNFPIALVTAATIILALSFDRTRTNGDRQRVSERFFLLILAVLFSVLMLRSRRFVEYASPVVVLCIAVIHRDFFVGLQSRFARAAAATLTVVVVVGCSLNTWSFVRDTRTDDRYRCYIEAGRWMNEHIPKGETVFISDWDDFPPLYMEAPYVRYVAGLDPLFMLLHDKRLYNLYCDVTLGKHKGPYSPLITEKFDSRYVFTDTEHAPFLKIFDREPGVYRVFGQKECRIYTIDKEAGKRLPAKAVGAAF